MLKARHLHSQLICGVTVSLLLVCSQAIAHTIDVIELPNEGGTRVITDGNILNTFPGSETISAGVNNNDGDFIAQIINVNLYDDAAHTIVSDMLTITVPPANLPQITVGLTSDTEGIRLAPLSPETIGLTETGALQSVITLTNSRGNQTTIRIQSDAPEATATPEPSTILLAAPVLLVLFTKRVRVPRPLTPLIKYFS
jgi:hypothetical protein